MVSCEASSKKETPRTRGFEIMPGNEALDGRHLSSGRTLRGLLDLEAYLLPLDQALETAALDGGVMHEYVFAAVLRRDEAKTFTFVEPLNCSGNHKSPLVDNRVLQMRGADSRE